MTGLDGTGGRALVGVSDRIPPQTMRDRQVHSIAVTCPTCGAEPEVKCRNVAGVEITTAHPVRRRMAIRAENAEPFDLTAVRFARFVPPSKRRVARENADLSRRQLEELLDLKPRCVIAWETHTNPTGPAGARYGAWLKEQA